MSEPVAPRTADALGAAVRWLARDGRVALATVIATWGSSPVPVGGQMAIAVDGSFEGSVSGGCIEGAVITEAAEVLEQGRPVQLSYGVADETAWSVGLPCGGQVRVFVERVETGGGDWLLRAADARTRRDALVIEKRLADGATTLHAADATHLRDHVADRFRSGRSGLVAMPDGEVFLHAVVPPARIVAIGATHITQVLADLARLAGYEIIVVDPRSAFADPARFPPGMAVLAEWPETALPRLGFDNRTAVVVLAHVENIDDEALALAARADVAYVGALGSKRNHARRVERLTTAGLSPAEIARIKSPIGLDIGAETPAEIALAVMAEVVHAVRRGLPHR